MLLGGPTVHTMLPAEVKSVYPEGGLFTWLELPGQIDTTSMLKEAVAQKVAYMPGREFFRLRAVHVRQRPSGAGFRPAAAGPLARLLRAAAASSAFTLSAG